MKTVLRKRRNGVAALSAILLIGGIISEVAMASLIASYLVSQEGLGKRISYEAELASNGAVEDAILKISREGDSYTPDGTPYTLSIGALNTSVSITKSVHASYSVFTIVATTSVLNKERKAQAVVILDSTTGVSNIESNGDIT